MALLKTLIILKTRTFCRVKIQDLQSGNDNIYALFFLEDVVFGESRL